MREIRGAFSAHECVQCVRGYAAEHPGDVLPSVRRVCQWASRSEVKARLGQRPQSAGPYERHFESWWDVLAAAGLVDGEPVSGRLRVRGARQVRPVSGRVYSDEQIHAALREVAGRVGCSPKTAEYRRERETVFD